MTVWTSDTGENEKKFWKRASETKVVADEETGEERTIFTEFSVGNCEMEHEDDDERVYLNQSEETEHGLLDRYTTNGGYHRQELWTKVFEDELPPSRRKLVELKLDQPIRVERGRKVGIYVHSAERGDQGIVYDNVAELGPRPKRDGRVIIHPGVAHLSFKPFGRSAPWGGISLRRNRQFVGKLGYAVRWMLWSEVNHHLFPIGYKQAVKELIKGNQLDRECALSIMPPEIMFAVLNKSCGWDWFGPQMRRIKRDPHGKSLFPEIQWSETCGKEDVDESLFRSSRRFQQGGQGRWIQIAPAKREYFARALKIFMHIMHEEYVVKLKERLAISMSSDEDEDDDEKSESELDGDYVSPNDDDEEKDEEEKEEDDGKRKTRATTKAKKAKKAPRRTKEAKIEIAIENRFERIRMLDGVLIEFVLHHTLDNLARELENLDLLIEEGFCDSQDEVDTFLTRAQLNQNLSMDLRVGTAGGSRKTALEELHEMNGGRRFEFEKGSNISGLYENEGTNVNSSCKYIVRELMPGSIMRKFETDLSHVHGSHIWYGNHGPTLGGLGGAFEGDEYSSSEEEYDEDEEEYDDDEEEYEEGDWGPGFELDEGEDDEFEEEEDEFEEAE